jgi:hypothetical protein
MGTVAQFLGWTRDHHGRVQPSHGCEVAFMAIDALDEGLVKEADLIGLDRGHIQELIRGMRRIAATEREEAGRQREQAEASQRRAAEAKASSGPLAPAPWPVRGPGLPSVVRARPRPEQCGARPDRPGGRQAPRCSGLG